jgi:hypothetical protein
MVAAVENVLGFLFCEDSFVFPSWVDVGDDF